MPTKQTQSGIGGYDRGIITIRICASSKTHAKQSSPEKSVRAKTTSTDSSTRRYQSNAQKRQGANVENPFDEEFRQDAIGLAALLVAIVGGVISGGLVVYSLFNWFELLKGLWQ